MPPEVANHVAAVALSGTPSVSSCSQCGAPPMVIGPLYAPKTTDLCAQGDTICDGGNDAAAHVLYAANGMTNQAADFAASHL